MAKKGMINFSFCFCFPICQYVFRALQKLRYNLVFPCVTCENVTHGKLRQTNDYTETQTGNSLEKDNQVSPKGSDVVNNYPIISCCIVQKRTLAVWTLNILFSNIVPNTEQKFMIIFINDTILTKRLLIITMQYCLTVVYFLF